MVGMLREFYAGAPFVRVLDNAPRVKDLVASNYAPPLAVANGRTVAVMSVVAISIRVPRVAPCNG